MVVQIRLGANSREPPIFRKNYYLLIRIKDQMNFDQEEGEFHIQDNARKLVLPFLEVHFFENLVVWFYIMT